MKPRLRLIAALIAVSAMPACPSRSAAASRCGLRYQPVAQIEGMKDRTRIGAVSRRLAYYTAYFQGGRVTDEGINRITFDAPQVKIDPAIIDSAPLANGTGWFLLRKVWFFDGKKAEQVPLPDGFEPEHMAYGGGKLWVSGRGGASIYRRDGKLWTPVRINDLRPQYSPRITLDRSGRPYAVVQTEVPNKPSPNGYSDLVLRLRSSIWMRDGSKWRNITPKAGGNTFVIGGADGELWTVEQGIKVQRFFDGAWAPVTLASPETREAIPTGVAFDRDGRLWIGGFNGAVTSGGIVQTPRLWVLEGKTIHRVPIKETDFEYEVSSVSAAPDGAIWLAGSTRIFRGFCTAGLTK